METDGIGMHVKHIGDRDDAHRIRRRQQRPQDVTAATEWLRYSESR